MDKINLKNVRELLNIKDSFEKSLKLRPVKDSIDLTNKDKELVDYISTELSYKNFDNIINQIYTPDGWTNSVEFVAFNKNDKNKIANVSIGLFDLEEGNIDLNIIDINKFIKIFTNLTAINIEKNPQKEALYKENYLKLLKYIEQNRADIK